MRQQQLINESSYVQQKSYNLFLVLRVEDSKVHSSGLNILTVLKDSSKFHVSLRVALTETGALLEIVF